MQLSITYQYGGDLFLLSLLNLQLEVAGRTDIPVAEGSHVTFTVFSHLCFMYMSCMISAVKFALIHKAIKLSTYFHCNLVFTCTLCVPHFLNFSMLRPFSKVFFNLFVFFCCEKRKELSFVLLILFMDLMGLEIKIFLLQKENQLI